MHRNFDGWCVRGKEWMLPLKYMTENHRKVIADKCSHPDKPKVFPDIPTCAQHCYNSVNCRRSMPFNYR